MKEEMIQVRVWASTNFINSTDEQIIEVDKDYWESMNDQEKEEITAYENPTKSKEIG